MDTDTPLFVGLLAALLAGLSPAQSPLSPTPSPSVDGRAALAAVVARGVPIHDEGHDARFGPLGIWAAGADYKCGFTDSGIVVVPYLGAAAPKSQPWRLTTTSVRVGDVELWAGSAAIPRGAQQFVGFVPSQRPFADGVASGTGGPSKHFPIAARDVGLRAQREDLGLRPDRGPRWDEGGPGIDGSERFDDWRFERRRGRVVERFDVRPEGVEQSFVVDRPANLPHGELRIRGRVDTELVADERAPRHAPIEFTGGAAGYRFSYGAAFAFDADGMRCDVPTSFDGGVITLHVPADFVAAAKWPILVDPLLQPLVMISGSSTGFGEIDVDAIDGDTPQRQIGIVWSRSASAADSDVYVYRAATDFTGGVLFATELTAAVSSRECAIAGSWIDATMTVVWSRATSTGSACYARPFAASAASGSLANAVVMPHPPGADESKPKVGGSKVLDMSPGHVMVVRLRETNGQTELVGTLFGTSTAQTYGWTRIATTNAFIGAIDEPSITKNVRGDYEAWVVAYQYWSTQNARWQVAVERISYVGTPSGSPLTLHLGTPARHAMRPRVDGCFGRYLVTFGAASVAAYPGQLTSYAGTTIEAQRIDWGASGGPTAPWPRSTVLTSTNRNLMADAIAANTENFAHWLVGSRHGGTARVTLLGFRGVAVTHEIVPAPSGAGTHVAQDVAVAFTPGTGNFAVLCDHTTNYQGVLTWTCTGRVRAYPDLPAPSMFGASCGLQTPTTFGTFRVGSDRGTVGQGGIAQGRGVLAALSLGTTDIPLAALGIPGGCHVIVDHAPQNFLAHVLLTPNSAGFAGLALPLLESLPPFDLRVQFFTIGTTPGAMVASRGVLVPVR